MDAFNNLKTQLLSTPKVWLVTGVGGFIGSNLLEALLKINQTVIGLDNFSTGNQKNLSDVQRETSPKQWSNFQLIKGDIRDIDICRKACKSVSYVLHQAALGSVSRSMDDPIETNQNNVDGFLNMLVSSKEENVDRFVYAASSSSYGDHKELPKTEDKIGKPLSPYAVTKLVNELYADVFSKNYGLNSIGLRYFNVFGRRQDPNGAYAAVIPKWASAMIKGKELFINGDGKTSRDFCYIDNVVQANLLAATADKADSVNQVYNIAVGDQTSLNELFDCIKNILSEANINYWQSPIYLDFRPGDVQHSLADISKASRLLDYVPIYSVKDGLRESMKWYIKNL